MDKPKVSVIIPIFNVEPYLRRCVDSVLAQTLTDIELILVDDGSTDLSGTICDDYKEIDERVIVKHINNSGVSVARNIGLDNAAGEYIAFVDSDDTIAPEMAEQMLSALQKENADLCICGFQRVSENYLPAGDKSSVPFQVLTGMQALEKLYTNDYLYFTIACNKLFKRSLFDSLRFPEGKLFEDGYVAFRYYFASRTIVCLPDCCYFYLTRSNSITTSSLSVKNLDGLDAEVDSIDFLKEKGCLDLLAKAETKYTGAVIYNLKRFDLNQKDVAVRFQEIRRDFSRLYPDIMKNTLLSKKEKLVITLFRISPRLCKLIIKVKKL